MVSFAVINKLTYCREDYLWSATVLSSRSFPSRLLSFESNVSDDLTPITKNVSRANGNINGSAEIGGDEPILVPILDMLNHKPNQPVTWMKFPNTITFITETDYEADSEIFNNYGAKGNEECTLYPSSQI